MSYLFKLVLAGDPFKKEQKEKYLGERFKTDFLSTMGANLTYLTSRIEHKGKKYEINWQIWEISDQIKFKEERVRYYYESMGAIIVIGINNSNELNRIHTELIEYNGRGVHIPIAILGYNNPEIVFNKFLDELENFKSQKKSDVYPIRIFLASEEDLEKIIDEILKYLAKVNVNKIEKCKKHKKIPLSFFTKKILLAINNNLAFGPKNTEMDNSILNKLDKHINFPYNRNNLFDIAFIVEEIKCLKFVFKSSELEQQFIRYI